MNCPSGHPNADGARFCGVCGLALAAAPPAPAPVPTTFPAATAPPTPASPQPWAAPAATSRPPQNGMGTAALVLGIIGLLIGGCILGPLAIIFGAVGISKANQGVATNKGSAVSGLILGIVGFLGWGLVVLIALGSSSSGY